MKIICCGKELEQEDGVNGTDFFVCLKCKTGYNVGYCKVDDEGEPIIE